MSSDGVFAVNVRIIVVLNVIAQFMSMRFYGENKKVKPFPEAQTKQH